MQNKLTPARLVLTILYLAIDDIDPEEVFAHAGIPAARLDDPDGLISASDIRLLMKSVIELTGDPALGLHLGQEIGIEMLDLVGMAVASAPDLRSALEMLTQYSPLLSTLAEITLVQEGERVRLVLTLVDELSSLPYFAEVCGAAFYCILQRHLDGNFFLRTIRSRNPAPAWREEYHEVLGDEAELLFEAGEDSVEFDSALLDLPLKKHSPGLYQYLRAQAARKLASLPQPESTTATVQRLISEHMGQRLIDLTLISEEMGLNPRTLQRRLKDENTSFLQLHDACRYRRAREQLLDRDISIELLAASLGYSEPANFYRAFKTWSGLTPSEYRRQYKSGT